MATSVDISVKVTDVTLNLRKLMAGAPDLIAAALQAELEIESTESQRRTPVDTGALRASHSVKVESAGGDITGTISVGGVAAPYAVHVHENLEAFHPVGQAKFLESTLNESQDFLAQRIARRIDLERLAR